MTFREFVERSLSDFEVNLGRDATDPTALEMQLRGARQFAQHLTGEPHRKGEPPTRRPQPEINRRFGGPRN